MHVGLILGYGLNGQLDLGAPITPTHDFTIDLKEFQQSSADIKSSKSDSSYECTTNKTDMDYPLPESINGSSPTPLPQQESDQLEQNNYENNHQNGIVEDFKPLTPLRLSSEFLGTVSEKFNYRIYLAGIPVGTAELRAWKDKADFHISLNISSDPILSAFYPVDDHIETRHINGNFIVTKIKQKEGAFVSDRGFTIFLRDKYVFWFDRITQRYQKESIPNSEVVDLLTGLYYLRNIELETGKAETVQIYDSNSYSALQVEVLQRETIRLPSMREIPSIKMEPQFTTDGIFVRSGTIQFWLSDDEFRVPVKLTTTIPIGKISAELIAADTKQ